VPLAAVVLPGRSRSDCLCCGAQLAHPTGACPNKETGGEDCCGQRQAASASASTLPAEKEKDPRRTSAGIRGYAASVKGRLLDSEAQVGQLKKEKRLQKAQYDNMMKKQGRQIEMLGAEVGVLEANNARLRSKYAKVHDILKETRGDNSKIAAAYRAVATEAQANEDKLRRELQRDISGLQRELDVVRGDNDLARAKTDVWRQKFADTHEQLRLRKADLRDIKGDRAEAVARAADAAAGYAEAVAEAEQLVQDKAEAAEAALLETAAADRRHKRLKADQNAKLERQKATFVAAKGATNTWHEQEATRLRRELMDSLAAAAAAEDTLREQLSAAQDAAASATTVNWKKDDRDKHSTAMEKCVWGLLLTGVPQTRVPDVLKTMNATTPLNVEWMPSTCLCGKMADSLSAFAHAHAAELLITASEAGDIITMMFDGQTNYTRANMTCPCGAGRRLRTRKHPHPHPSRACAFFMKVHACGGFFSIAIFCCVAVQLTNPRAAVHTPLCAAIDRNVQGPQVAKGPHVHGMRDAASRQHEPRLCRVQRQVRLDGRRSRATRVQRTDRLCQRLHGGRRQPDRDDQLLSLLRRLRGATGQGHGAAEQRSVQRVCPHRDVHVPSHGACQRGDPACHGLDDQRQAGQRHAGARHSR